MRSTIRIGVATLFLLTAGLVSSQQTDPSIYDPDTRFSASTIVLFIHGYRANDRPIVQSDGGYFSSDNELRFQGFTNVSPIVFRRRAEY